ncbi:hypothetical protein QAD02_022128 [Eretmocerus hayati]|uniref:Uncharacterized protein n=1 Tax=Eretmocerus hayati TaxID=131215 RepID=A0ACC2PRW3_9HYME|nr:hypothetical protein QAD02_022128 [Eretmocerus hayati]
MGELKQYTVQDVKSANDDRMRTMLIIYDKVYDLTDFLNEHPGGEEILLDHGGKDASEDFDDVGHSTDAHELMEKYLVGEIVESERRNLTKKSGWKPGYNSTNPEKEKYVQGPGTPFVAFAGAVILAAIALFYFFN